MVTMVNLTADNRDVEGRVIVVAEQVKHCTLNQKNPGSNPCSCIELFTILVALVCSISLSCMNEYVVILRIKYHMPECFPEK